MNKTIFSLSAGALAVALFSFKAVKEDSYNVSTKESKLEWFAEKVTGKHNGVVNIKSGSLTMAEGVLKKGDFLIDMPTIEATDLTGEYKQKLDGHLKSADFFDVEKFNTAKIVIKNANLLDKAKGTYNVTGDLTIKGITHEITFPATLKVSGGNVTGNAEFSINRTKWDIKYGSANFFESLGDKAIYDDIKFKVALVAKAK